LIDFYWANEKSKRSYKCSTCNEANKKKRKCQDDGYEHSKKGWQIDDFSINQLFCPGKATWSHEMAKLFLDCKTAYIIGEYPDPGRLEDQEATFSEVYPTFVERWEERKYFRNWQMFNEVGPKYLEQFIKGVNAPWTK